MSAQSEAVDLPAALQAETQARQAAEARAEAALAQAAQERELRRTAEQRIRTELVADFTPMRAELRASEERFRQLRDVLDEERERHAAELAALRQQHADALAEVRQEHGEELAEVRQEHGEELAEVRQEHGEELAAALAEGRSDQAGSGGSGESEQAAERRRLRIEAARLDRMSAAVRKQVEQANTAQLAATHQVAAIQAELDRVTEERDDLAAKLAPPSDPGPLVAVRWLRDSPAEGCHVGSGVYRGKGPRFRRRALLLGGHPTGCDTSEVEQPGDVHAIPRGAAQALSRAGYVYVLSAELRDLPTPAPRPHPLTVEQLRDEGRALLATADAFERAIAEAEQDQDQDQGDGAAEQV